MANSVEGLNFSGFGALVGKNSGKEDLSLKLGEEEYRSEKEKVNIVFGV